MWMCVQIVEIKRISPEQIRIARKSSGAYRVIVCFAKTNIFGLQIMENPKKPKNCTATIKTVGQVDIENELESKTLTLAPKGVGDDSLN
jgi:hypothetical protein